MYRLLPLLASFAATDVESAIRSRKRNALLYLVIAVLVFTAWMATTAAAAIALAERFGAAEGALLVSGSMVLLAVMVRLSIFLFDRADRRRHSAVNNHAVLGMAALAAAPIVLRSRAAQVLALAGVAAFAATRHHPGGRSLGDTDFE